MLEYMCAGCGTTFIRYNSANRYCGKCQYNRYAKPKKPIKKMGKISKKWIETRHDWIKKNTNESGTWNCYICNKLLTIDTLTLDHKQSRSHRPDLRFNHDNLAACCWECNDKKGSKST